MDRFCRSVAAKTERDLWIRNQKRMLEAKERAEVLERAVCNCWNWDSSHVLRIFDEEAQAMSIHGWLCSGVGKMLVGEAILSAIYGQRERLKVNLPHFP
ncbi:hypothetical protein ACSQ67_016983 [Phaseolus vulgaris]